MSYIGGSGAYFRREGKKNTQARSDIIFPRGNNHLRSLYNKEN